MSGSAVGTVLIGQGLVAVDDAQQLTDIGNIAGTFGIAAAIQFFMMRPCYFRHLAQHTLKIHLGKNLPGFFSMGFARSRVGLGSASDPFGHG